MYPFQALKILVADFSCTTQPICVPSCARTFCSSPSCALDCWAWLQYGHYISAILSLYTFPQLCISDHVSILTFGRSCPNNEENRSSLKYIKARYNTVTRNVNWLRSSVEYCTKTSDEPCIPPFPRVSQNTPRSQDGGVVCPTELLEAKIFQLCQKIFLLILGPRSVIWQMHIFVTWPKSILGHPSLSDSFNAFLNMKMDVVLGPPHRGLVVKASDFHAGGRGFDSRLGQATH